MFRRSLARAIRLVCRHSVEAETRRRLQAGLGTSPGDEECRPDRSGEAFASYITAKAASERVGVSVIVVLKTPGLD